MYSAKYTTVACLFLCLALAKNSASAATWSDTLIGYRHGTHFTEPNNTKNIHKDILHVGYASGYAGGENFFNIDALQSDDNDPANGGDSGATEMYLVYRHQLYLGQLLDKNLAFGPVKEIAITLGFDLNSKNTAFAPNKRLVLVGPTFKFNVPGFFYVGLWAGREWNHCGLDAQPGSTFDPCPKSTIRFDNQWFIGSGWGIPFSAGSIPLKFQGFLMHGSEKGKDYADVNTKAETLMRTSLMLDAGQLIAQQKNKFYLGIGYEYWRNKFGNHAYSNGNEKPGINTHAPTLQTEWHF
jgi:nucleoside-specific outer membrane channel protein Tsx